MFSFIRRTKKSADTAAVQQRLAELQASAAQRAARQQKAHSDRMDLLDRLSNRYYLAHALSTHGTKYQTGVAHGVSLAIAEVLGKDILSVGYALERGLSLTGTEFCVYETIDGTEVALIRSNDPGVREPMSARLDRLHRKALRADNHPMYHVLYGTVAA